MNNQLRSTPQMLLWVSIFGIAMAYMEAAIVVYLRMIFYPEGFDFPLSAAPSTTIFIELGREAATIVMLVAVGIICGRSKIERFAYLLLSFGIWDIMYYVWLWVQIGWPPSLFTWDILFLIPVPWVGPVIAPVLVSIAMIWAALLIIMREEKGRSPKFTHWAWWGEIAAGLIIIISFIYDAGNLSAGGYPNPFRWDIFAFGLLAGVILFCYMMRSQAPKISRELE